MSRKTLRVSRHNDAVQCNCSFALVCVANRRQIGLWEKKIQLVKETRSTVGEVQDEIKMMKKEIHRMEVK